MAANDITAGNITATGTATVPTPTLAGQAANKSYVDAQVSPKANLNLFDQILSASGEQKINGLIIKWGLHNPSPLTKVVTFPTAFPNEIFHIQLTPYDTSVAVGVDASPAPTVTGFTFLSASNTAVYWLAIGR